MVSDSGDLARARDEGERLFLLSPAFCGGRRSAALLGERSQGVMAQRLRAGTLTLGEAFSFLSGLYFRGKLAYARRYGRSTRGPGAAFVITPSRGLLDPDQTADETMIREFAAGDVAVDNAAYRTALEHDAAALAARVGPGAAIVLLGSVATGKYVDLLAPCFGDRLCFPSAFIGRGDMSRGGLLLRSASSGVELTYEPIRAGLRPRGARPPKLTPLS
ncbi:MAG: hypothetical protein IT184_13460 [Acidobacteria bacterium]|nr:hypothetical protein [Acidobacteriota bacterium]